MRGLTDYELQRAFKLLADVQDAALELAQLGLRPDPDLKQIEVAAISLMTEHRHEAHRRTTASSPAEASAPKPTNYSPEARLAASLRRIGAIPNPEYE